MVHTPIVRAVVRASKVRFSYSDHDKQERVLEESSLHALILRPTILTNDESLACVEILDPRLFRYPFIYIVEPGDIGSSARCCKAGREPSSGGRS